MTEERFITYEAAREIFATKADIAELKAEVKTDIAKVRTEVAELRAEVKADIGELKTEVAELRAEVKTDIAELETRIVKWMVGTQLGGIAAFAAVATAIIAVLKLLGG